MGVKFARLRNVPPGVLALSSLRRAIEQKARNAVRMACCFVHGQDAISMERK